MLKRSQVAHLLGVGITHVSNLIESGVIRAVDVAHPEAIKHSYRIPVREIQKFLEKRIV